MLIEQTCDLMFGAIEMFVVTVTVYEIIKFNPSKWSQIEYMTFKK